MGSEEQTQHDRLHPAYIADRLDEMEEIFGNRLSALRHQVGELEEKGESDELAALRERVEREVAGINSVIDRHAKYAMQLEHRLAYLEMQRANLHNRLASAEQNIADHEQAIGELGALDIEKRLNYAEHHIKDNLQSIHKLLGRMAQAERTLENIRHSHRALYERSEHADKKLHDRLTSLEQRQRGEPMPGLEPEKVARAEREFAEGKGRKLSDIKPTPEPVERVTVREYEYTGKPDGFDVPPSNQWSSADLACGIWKPTGRSYTFTPDAAREAYEQLEAENERLRKQWSRAASVVQCVWHLQELGGWDYPHPTDFDMETWDFWSQRLKRRMKRYMDKLKEKPE